MREKDRKGRKVAIHCVFPMIWGSGGSKSRLAKAAGAEPADQRRDEKLHAVVARGTFPSQNAQNTPFSDRFWKLRCRKSARRCGAKHISKSKCIKHHVRTTFGSWDVEKVHAVVARSTFPSQNVQNTPHSDHFWKLRRRKSARRCGAKHIFKSKCTKHTTFGPLLEVEISKKCTPLWREAHFQVKMYKMYKALGFGPLLEVPMWEKCTPFWREAHFEVKMLKTLGVRTTFGGSDVPLLRFTTLHYITLEPRKKPQCIVYVRELYYITFAKEKCWVAKDRESNLLRKRSRKRILRYFKLFVLFMMCWPWSVHVRNKTNGRCFSVCEVLCETIWISCMLCSQFSGIKVPKRCDNML